MGSRKSARRHDDARSTRSIKAEPQPKSSDELDADKIAELWQEFAADHYEIVEQLPLELHRNSRLLRELDQESLSQQNRLQTKIREYIAYRIEVALPPDPKPEPSEHEGQAEAQGGIPEQQEAAGDQQANAEVPRSVDEGDLRPTTEDADETEAVEAAVELSIVEPDAETGHATVPHNADADGEADGEGEEDAEGEIEAPGASPNPLDLTSAAQGEQDREGEDDGEGEDDADGEEDPDSALAVESRPNGDHSEESVQMASPIQVEPPAETITMPSAAPTSVPQTRPTSVAPSRLPSRMQTTTPGPSRPSLGAIASLVSELVRNREEKVAIAVGAYNTIDRHIRALDSALSAQEGATLLGISAPPETPAADQQSRRSHKKKKKTATVEPPTAVAALEAPPVGLDADPNEPRYCYCHQVSYGQMIGCENEEDCPYEWFHLSCVGLTAPPQGKWLCPTCRPGGSGQKKRKR